MATNLLYEDLTYEVIGCAFEAFKEVGVGFEELIYHKVFHEYLLERGLKAQYKVPIQLNYRSRNIGDFEVDEIVEDKLIVELKFIQKDFLPENYAQLFTYLKITRLDLGLLINFGLQKASIKRVIFQPTYNMASEQWDDNYFLSFPAREVLDAVIAATKTVDQALLPGYHSDLYKEALKIEFKNSGIQYNENVSIKITAKGIQFDPFEIDYWLIENAFLFAVLAGKGKIRAYDILRMRSYLKRLNLSYGLIAHWNTKELQLCGIYEP